MSIMSMMIIMMIMFIMVIMIMIMIIIIIIIIMSIMIIMIIIIIIIIIGGLRRSMQLSMARCNRISLVVLRRPSCQRHCCCPSTWEESAQVETPDAQTEAETPNPKRPRCVNPKP